MARATHPVLIRITHCLNAIAIVVLMGSGWNIYDASPIFGFAFPNWMILGGWLGGALALHFAAMWLLAGSMLVMLGYGFLSGHLRRRMLPLRPSEVVRDLWLALRLALPHQSDDYNAVQRLAYVTVLSAILAAIVSGLAIWKPVQFEPLTEFLGGFEAGRIVHFCAMAVIGGFLVLHLALVVLVPRTLWPMLLGTEPVRNARAHNALRGAQGGGS